MCHHAFIFVVFAKMRDTPPHSTIARRRTTPSWAVQRTSWVTLVSDRHSGKCPRTLGCEVLELT